MLGIDLDSDLLEFVREEGRDESGEPNQWVQEVALISSLYESKWFPEDIRPRTWQPGNSSYESGSAMLAQCPEMLPYHLYLNRFQNLFGKMLMDYYSVEIGEVAFLFYGAERLAANAAITEPKDALVCSELLLDWDWRAEQWFNVASPDMEVSPRVEYGRKLVTAIPEFYKEAAEKNFGILFTWM